MIAAAFAFGMTACNGNKAAEETTDTVATECCGEAHECCGHEGECTCEDTTCAQKNCEECPNHGTENCCKVKAGEKACCGNHEGCEHQCDGNHEGCEHNCEHHK